MRCSRCNFDNPDGLKFCTECAAPLGRRCAGCGFENPPSAKFCGQCAAALTADVTPAATRAPTAPSVRDDPPYATADSADGERKTVTALFADIKGSTELEQDLDPEEARAIVDPALKLMIDAVQRYDGYIVQSTGDGIFALFGAPVAHEDHPQRALYAALRMQEELKRYSAKLVADGGMPIEARIGTNTGEVVVRSISTGGGHVEYTPIGHTTNLASRMQAVAPTGSIATSEQTRKFVEGYFALRAMGPTKVKGVSEPVNVYEVTGLGPLRTRLQRSAGRGLSKFVGRQAEMDALKRAAEQAQAGRGQIVAAIAEAGVGKSRLLFEFKVTTQSGWMVLEAFSVSHGKASAFLPVIELLWNYFKITSEDDARTRRERVTGRVLALERTLEDTLPYLFSLLGIVEGDDPLEQMDGQIKKRRTLEAIKRILLRESMNQPLIVIFEDLHWINEETQAFLNLLADSIANAKILLLVNFRLEYHLRWANKSYCSQLRLDPLRAESTSEMLTGLLGDGAEMKPAKRFITEKTQGNPFFIEEVVQALFDEGVLVRNGTLKQAKSLSELRLPSTVQGVLAARIDRLASNEKGLLQILSVVGKQFPLRLIQRVAEKGEDELQLMLGRLQAAEFIYEQPAFADVEYSFKHALTQEVAYNSVLGERRKVLHEQVARGIEKLYKGRLEEHFTELAYHYGRTANLEKAARYMRMAGQRAYFQGEYSEALTRLTATLELLAKLPEGRERDRQEVPTQLVLGVCRANLDNPGSSGVGQAYQRALELAERLGEPPSLFRALIGVFVNAQFGGDLRQALSYGERLVQLAEQQNDPVMLAEAYCWAAQGVMRSSDLLGAKRLLERALAVREQLPAAAQFFFTDPRGQIQGGLAALLWLLGFPNQALKLGEAQLSVAEENYGLLPLRIFEAAITHRRVGDWRKVRELSERSIKICTEYGLSFELERITGLHGWALGKEGHVQEGIAELSRGLQQDVGVGSAFRYARQDLAELYGQTGRGEEGLKLVDDSIVEDPQWLVAETYRLKGELLLVRNTGAIAEAEACFRQAIALARESSAKSYELRATTSLARLLAKQGKRDEARAMLREIYNWFTEGFDTADLKDAKALLEELTA